MKLKRIIPVLLAVAVILVMVAGCGEETTTTSATTPGTTGTTGGTTSTTAAPAYIPDVVNVGLDGDPTDLDPFTAVSHKNGTSHPLFLQTLGYLNSDGTYSGVLMKSYEQPDAKTINVTLYDNIVDQAGNPFTAADAVWGLQKHVENHNQFATSIASVTQTGDYTFTITLSHDAYLNDLTNIFINLLFVTKAAWEASPDHMVTDPVSTAPYKVTAYTSGSKLTLEKWDGYWKTDESLKTPVEQANVKQINFFVIMENNQAVIALQTGQIDFHQNILFDDVATFDGSDKTKVYTFGETMCHVLWPNCDPASVCSDKRVREAIFYAIDARSLATQVFGDAAELSKAVGNPYYADYIAAWADADYWNYDPQKAKDLLAEAGYTADKPLKLRMICMDHPIFKPIMEIVQGYLTEVGIDAQLTALQGGGYFETSSKPTDWDLQHFPAFSNDFIPSFWSNMLQEFSPGGAINFAKDDQLQKLISAAQTVATHNQDTVAAGQAYINENAYAYGLCPMYVNTPYPVWCTKLVLSDHLWLLPNACTYTQP
jgi:ABC-type transport system substrate-binding protein